MEENEEKRGGPSPEEEEYRSNAARRLKVAGGSDEDPIHEGQAAKGSFWSNFWYHHKGTVIMVCAFALILGVGITQLLTKKDPDIFIMYAGPAPFNINTTDEAEKILGDLTEDYNDDGKKAVRFATIFYVTDENVEREIDRQIEEAKEKGEEVYDRDWYYHNTYLAEYSYSQQNHSQYENFSNEIFAGDSVIVLLDPALYESVRESGGFMKLSEVFGYAPEGAVDEYGIRFSETEIAKFYPVFSSLPDDTVLAVRQVSTMSAFTGKKKAQKVHDDHVAFARAMLAFTPPEEAAESGE